MSTAQDLAERALTAARTDDCVVIVDETSTTYLRWAGNDVIANGVTEGRQVTVVAIVDGRTGRAAGVVTRSGDGSGSVAEMVRAAEHAARRDTVADDGRSLPAGGSAGDWLAPAEHLPADALGSLIDEFGAVRGRARAERRLLYGFAERRLRTTYLASSAGSRLRYVQPTAVLDLTARTEDHSASAWTGTGSPMVGVAALDTELRDRLGWTSRRIELPAGRYEVLLSPSCVADLMMRLYQAAGALDALDGRTVFSRPGGGVRVGERLSRLPLTLRSDPNAAGLECTPFVTARSTDEASVFDNGLPLQPTEWIDHGVLNALVHSRHSAELTGSPVTPGVDNLLLDGAPGGPSLPEMVAGTDHALLITSLWYIRDVHPGTLLLTGLTRDGVHLVRHGEIVAAVNNFRFNESPVRLLDRVIEVGVAEPTLPREWGDYFTRMAMPPLRVADFRMSAVSPAT